MDPGIIGSPGHSVQFHVMEEVKLGQDHAPLHSTVARIVQQIKTWKGEIAILTCVQIRCHGMPGATGENVPRHVGMGNKGVQDPVLPQRAETKVFVP